MLLEIFSYFFRRHHCYPAPIAPPSFRPCPSIYFLLFTWTHFCLGNNYVCSSLNHYSSFIFGWAFWDGIWTFLRMFHTRKPILRVFKIIPSCCFCYLWDIFSSVALMLGASKLLAMANDIGGFHPIVVGEVFLWLINCSIVYNFRGHFKSTYPPLVSSIDPWRLWSHPF